MKDTYKRLSQATFAKFQGTWNKTWQSHLANEVIEDKCLQHGGIQPTLSLKR